MKLGDYAIYDIESDNLYDKATKIHCLCIFIVRDFKVVDQLTYRADGKGHGTIEEGLMVLQSQPVVCGHNIMFYDQRLIVKLYPFFKEPLHIWDSLALTWYLYPKQFKNGVLVNRKKYGLEEWGHEFGYPKVKIDDWENQTLDEYCERCFRDCEINFKIMEGALQYLLEIYESSEEEVLRFIAYLQFKMECAREQMDMGLYVDRDKCKRYLEEVEAQILNRFQALEEVMPQKPIIKTTKKPKVLFKKDNTLSAAGVKYRDLCLSQGKNYLTTPEVTFISGYNKPNAGSPAQVKDWLFSLGWEPVTFKDVKNSEGKFNAVPQLNGEDGELCSSIMELIDDNPSIEVLAGLSILKHRKGVFQGFLDNSTEDGWTFAGIQGLTNTLRFKHTKPIANLPKVSKPWGKEIRSLICVPENSGYVLCGSDMSSLEDTTKQHYMYYFDPEYVKQMRVPGFDPHIDIAVFAELITPEDEVFYKEYVKAKEEAEGRGEKYEPENPEDKKRYSIIHEIRGSKAKPVNFGGVYGVGAEKLSKMLKSTLMFATDIHTKYWQRNKAVKQVEEAVEYKELYGQLWLYNPVSRFWYTLRALKDRFSTLNQGTGVYCFDTNLMFIRKKEGIKVILQYHDEIGFPVLVEEQQATREKLNRAISAANDYLKLNVPLGISMDFGSDYSQIH